MTPQTHAVGIDIGGTKTAVAVLERHGTLVARTVLQTEAGLGFSRAMDRISAAIHSVLREAGSRPKALAGIGIGCAGPVDPLKGLINNPYTLEGWNQCDIVTPLQERFQVPVRLENDADAAALGEHCAGAGAGANPMVMLTVGTGVGGGVILKGQIYRGAEGEHPELGHLIVASDGPACYCGARGCLESIASGTAIGESGRTHGFVDSHEVFQAARRGEPAAMTVLSQAIDALASAAWTICHAILPQRLVLGGGVMAEHFDLFVGPIGERLGRATQFTPANISIVPATLGNSAGMIGAAALMWRPIAGC